MQAQAPDGVGQASSLQGRAAAPAGGPNRGPVTPRVGEALEGERSGHEQMAGLGDGLGARSQYQGPSALGSRGECPPTTCQVLTRKTRQCRNSV